MNKYNTLNYLYKNKLLIYVSFTEIKRLCKNWEDNDKFN